MLSKVTSYFRATRKTARKENVTLMMISMSITQCTVRKTKKAKVRKTPSEKRLDYNSFSRTTSVAEAEQKQWTAYLHPSQVLQLHVSCLKRVGCLWFQFVFFPAAKAASDSFAGC